MTPRQNNSDACDPIEAALRDRVAVPDQTRAIMGRLGYMRVGSDVAQRHRRQAQIRRFAYLLMMAGAVSVGYGWYRAAGDLRRADEITLPSAIAGQVEQRGAALTGLLESIRPIDRDLLLESKEPEDQPQPTRTEPVEQGDSGGQPMIELPQQDEAPATVAIAPFRWT